MPEQATCTYHSPTSLVDHETAKNRSKFTESIGRKNSTSSRIFERYISAISSETIANRGFVNLLSKASFHFIIYINIDLETRCIENLLPCNLSVQSIGSKNQNIE